MPQMANITVKAANGTTDVVFTALTPSAGDNVAAQWRANAASAIPGHRPVLSAVSRWNGPKTGRRVDVKFDYPVVDTSGTSPIVIARIPVNFSVVIPQAINQDAANEAVAQATNLLVSTLLRQSISEGFMPT